jgi:serine/threonine protein phosphatase PrpC
MSPSQAAAPNAGWRLLSVARTHTGHVRSHNEDSVVDLPAEGVWAVADGMGGHSRGEVASGRISDALEALRPSADGLEAHLAATRAGIERVHARLLAESGGVVSGSTVAVLLVDGDRCVCVWAGDSRVYRRRGGTLERLTRDHSLVEELVAVGAVAAEDAARHPLANRITRAVGVGGQVELEEVVGEIRAGDRYLLSTDGLHGVVPHALMNELAGLPDLAGAADALLKAALDAGAPDNVSLVLVAVEPAEGASS